MFGDEVIIGQTVLEKLDLHVDCRGQPLYPNPAHPDQPVLKMKSVSADQYSRRGPQPQELPGAFSMVCGS